MSYRSGGGDGAQRGIPSSSANMTPVGGGRGPPPPAKRPRTHSSGYNSPTTAAAGGSGVSYGGRAGERGGGYEFAGKNADKMFPDVRDKQEHFPSSQASLSYSCRIIFAYGSPSLVSPLNAGKDYSK